MSKQKKKTENFVINSLKVITNDLKHFLPDNLSKIIVKIFFPEHDEIAFDIGFYDIIGNKMIENFEGMEIPLFKRGFTDKEKEMYDEYCPGDYLYNRFADLAPPHIEQGEYVFKL